MSMFNARKQAMNDGIFFGKYHKHILWWSLVLVWHFVP